jgi:hypothetical protein
MPTADIRFGRYKNGLPHVAHVVLEVEGSSAGPGIEFTCSGRGFTSQGYIEEVPAVGYDDWKDGARVGVSFALSAADKANCRVVVSKIEGLTTDTNPTIVAYAAAQAVWRSLDFVPAKDIIDRMEAIVFSSWERPHDEIPRFG